MMKKHGLIDKIEDVIYWEFVQDAVVGLMREMYADLVVESERLNMADMMNMMKVMKRYMMILMWI